MSFSKFWVIGGKYRDLGFQTLTSDTPTVLGPFDNEEIAKSEWRRVSFQHRSAATTRFSIVREIATGAGAH